MSRKPAQNISNVERRERRDVLAVQRREMDAQGASADLVGLGVLERRRRLGEITVDRLAERQRARRLDDVLAALGADARVNPVGSGAMEVHGLLASFGERNEGILAKTAFGAPARKTHDPTSGE